MMARTAPAGNKEALSESVMGPRWGSVAFRLPTIAVKPEESASGAETLAHASGSSIFAGISDSLYVSWDARACDSQHPNLYTRSVPIFDGGVPAVITHHGAQFYRIIDGNLRFHLGRYVIEFKRLLMDAPGIDQPISLIKSGLSGRHRHHTDVFSIKLKTPVTREP